MVKRPLVYSVTRCNGHGCWVETHAAQNGKQLKQMLTGQDIAVKEVRFEKRHPFHVELDDRTDQPIVVTEIGGERYEFPKGSISYNHVAPMFADEIARMEAASDEYNS
jgi:hypothetical protein